MGLTLLSATPSPYARKVRVTLLEKGITFELKNEVPWDSTSETPKFNPLEQLPCLILDDGSAVYDSSHILEFISLKYGDGKSDLLLFPEDVDDKLKAKQVDVLATGMMDALEKFFEQGRGDKASAECTARQERKIQGGLDALHQYAKGGHELLVGKKLTVADLSVGSVLGMYDLLEVPWKESRPELAEYWSKLSQRESYKTTEPYMFEIKDKIV